MPLRESDSQDPTDSSHADVEGQSDVPSKAGGSIVSTSKKGSPRGGLVPFDSSHIGVLAGLEKGPEDIPDRYDIREKDTGPALVCREAPGIAVHLNRSFSFSEAEARKLPARSILLDGAGAFAPLVDDNAHLFNLDHHQGCSRAFTLATCEQALILVCKGLELDVGDWTVYANEPDLDTVFAIWILLNHRRLRNLSPETRDRIIPLIRLEGAIDANGLEIAELCGLPQAALAVEMERLDALHAIELESKATGTWGTKDLAGYTREMLLEIDKLVFRGSDFQDYSSIDKEYGHVEIGQGKVAVVCRDDGGIYDVEKRLKKVWGDRLGIVALQKDRNHYTLRRVAALSGIELESAYNKLNLLDPAVDGRPASKRWGGSDDIGGSPRPTGTGLSAREIAKILKLTYKKVRPVQHLQRLATSALWILVLALVGGVSVVGLRNLEMSAATPQGLAMEMGAAALVVSLAAWLLTRQVSRGWMWLYGWRRPAGIDWWFLVPLVLIGAVAGGAWIPAELPADRGALGVTVIASLLIALAVELGFRGLVHGLLILDHPVQTAGGRWFISRPNFYAAAFFAAATCGLSLLWISPHGFEVPEAWHWPLMIGGSLLTGLSLGGIRERALSVWPCVLALGLGQLARLAFGLFGS